MKLSLYFGLIFLMSISLKARTDFNPPETKKEPVLDTMHGFEFTDYYRWLEDKDDPKVKTWSHAQHEYTIDYINKTTKEIPGLRDEIKVYLDRDYKSAPFYEGERLFFYARKKGEQQNKLYTVIDGKEKIIFDPEEIDTSGKSAITGADFTEDGEKAAIGVQHAGNEISDYRIVDTRKGEILGEVIEDLGGFSWTKDEKHAYVVQRTQDMIDKQIPLKTYLHKVGDDRDNDKFLAQPEDAKDFISIWDSEEADVTFFSEGDFRSNTLKISEAGIMDESKTIYSSKKFTANPEVKNGKIYFYTNHKAPNYKIMVADLDNPKFENWEVFYPEKETVLEGFSITSDYVIVRYKEDVLSHLQAYDMEGHLVKDIELPEAANVSGMRYHKESNTVFVSLSTFTNSAKVYKLDGKTLKWEFFYKDDPPIDTKGIESKLVFYYSKDSTCVPIFIVHKKGIKLDGSNPVLLYGYGGFNYGMKPHFLGTTAAFVNRGGIYAIACLRGGNEYGENWHKEGMMYKKQNTFDDFIAAAEFLVNENYTNYDKLAIKGGSNGGLLVGAVITQRPDICETAICAVPLLDMLRYHKFLIARYWIPEYGDPDRRKDFFNLLEYSPYHNISKGYNYPTMLVKAGENDSRVDALHAKKFAAALQNHPSQKNPVMLFIDFESGHGSGQSIDQLVDNIELEWRFLMNELEMTND